MKQCRKVELMWRVEAVSASSLPVGAGAGHPRQFLCRWEWQRRWILGGGRATDLKAGRDVEMPRRWLEGALPGHSSRGGRRTVSGCQRVVVGAGGAVTPLLLGKA